jgi:hypothetical protein
VSIRHALGPVVVHGDLHEWQLHARTRAKRLRPWRIVATDERIRGVRHPGGVVDERPEEHISGTDRGAEERIEIAVRHGDRDGEVSPDRIRGGSAADAREKKKDDAESESTFLHPYPPL